jgi:hypothetical protein
MEYTTLMRVMIATACIGFPIIYFITVIDIVITTDVTQVQCLVTPLDNKCKYTPINCNFTGVPIAADCPNDFNTNSNDYFVQCYVYNKVQFELNEFAAQMEKSDMQNNLMVSSAIMILLGFALATATVICICLWVRKRWSNKIIHDTTSHNELIVSHINPELLEEIPLEREEV